MTSETYLDLTFERATKSAKRPIRPKLLKLTDVTIPHRNRKKTKVKSKDRSASSVRDRIYDDPAYTDDISHLANPMRRSSCSGKSDIKAGTMAGAMAANPTSTGSSSLGKRSKLTKEFLQYAKQGKVGRVAGASDRGGSYEQDASSSSDEQGDMGSRGGSSSGMGRRGRSLERSMAEKTEKKREKRERSSKQKRNQSLDNNLQADMGSKHIQQQQLPPQQQQHVSKKKQQLELEVRSVRSKERKAQLLLKQYSDGAPPGSELWNKAGAHLPPPDQDEMYSVRSSSKESTSTANKMQIGRRLLKGEIGIKSFNYYLLKEGLKTSKKFVEKQRHSLTGGLSGSSKKLHTRSEENIYEEIFFKDAPASDEEQPQQQKQQKVKSKSQQPPPLPPPQQHHSVDTPLSQDSEEAIYPDCELCMQQCSKENCDYCFVAPPLPQAQAELLQTGSQRGTGVRQYAATTVRQASLHQQTQQQQTHNKPHFGSLGRSGGVAFINQAQSTTTTTTTSVAGIVQQQRNNNSNGGGGGNNSSGSGGSSNIMPNAHILEFQSYNPNNPGVYKIETTPVAITGEYNPILQFQQQQQHSSSSTTTTATTTPSDQQQQQQHQQLLHQQQQQMPLQYKPPVALQQTQAYLLQTGMPLSSTTMTNHYQSISGAGAGGNGAGMLPKSLPTRHNHRGGRPMVTTNGQQQHFIVSYNGAASMQRMHTKSSSSSDSLQQHHHLNHHHHKQQQQQHHQQHQQQQLHKFNTMARLEATNVLLGDPFYGGAGVGQMHPLMYAASRPIGGSQILVDSYEPPQMYKSDSKASILSEYSLRSSDNSHRYAHYRYGNIRGGGEVSDSSLGDSLFSTYYGGGRGAQRRYFGSSESCRFAFECRRCSLDGGGGGRREGGDKCSYSDTCRYECRNCDCSSSYFSSDFDEVYGGSLAGGHKSSGIPRKTAAGTLPSSTPADFDDPQQQLEQLDLKQNKYAQDFFKHVNDVKRSIYQSEMQRHGSLETATQQRPQPPLSESAQYGRAYRSKHDNSSASPHCGTAKQQLQPIVCATLPLTKDSMRATTRASSTEAAIVTTTAAAATQMHPPKPAPRTSLQQQTLLTQSNANAATPPQPTQRRSQTLERREYPSLDRLVAAATGAIPKSSNSLSNSNHSGNVTSIKPPKGSSATKTVVGAVATNSKKPSPQQSPKSMRITDRPLGLPANVGVELEPTSKETIKVTSQIEEQTSKQRERFLNVGSGSEPVGNSTTSSSSKRHHRTSSAKASSMFATRRKDIPAPPPPSPATYADLQELRANLVPECGIPEEAAMRKVTQKTSSSSRQKEEQPEVATLAATAATGKTQQTKAKNVEKTKPTSDCGSNVSNIRETTTTTTIPSTTIETATSLRQAEKKIKAHFSLAAAQATTAVEQGVKTATGAEYAISRSEQQLQKATTNNAVPKGMNEATTSAASVAQTIGMPETSSPSITLTSTMAANFDAEDDDVFYDARSEDSAGTAASVASSSLVQRRQKNVLNLDGGHKRPQQQQQHLPSQQQQQIASNAKSEPDKLHATKGDENDNNNDDDDCNKTFGTSSGSRKYKDTREHEAENGQQSRKDTSGSSTNNNNNIEKRAGRNVTSEESLQSAMALNLAAGGALPIKTMPTMQTSTISTTTTPTATAQQHQQYSSNMVSNNANTPKREQHHARTKRRSSSSSRTRSHKPTAAAVTPTTPTTTSTAAPKLTISCDTCCQIECEQQQQQQQQKQQQLQKRQQTQNTNEMPLPPRAKTKTSKERASKIKQEETTAFKEKPKKQNEKSTTTTTPTTCAVEMLPTTAAAVAEPAADVAAQLAASATLRAAAVAVDAQEIGAQNAVAVAKECSYNIAAEFDNNVAATCSAEVMEKAYTDDNSGSHNVAAGESSNNVAATCCVENVAQETSSPIVAEMSTAAEATSTIAAVNTPTETVTEVSTTAEATSTIIAVNTPTELAPATLPLLLYTAEVTHNDDDDAAAAAVNDDDKDEEEAVAVDDVAEAEASVANPTAVSCNSDSAGVATLSHSISSTVQPPIATAHLTQQAPPLAPLEQLSRRPPLHRQEYSCLDSSEAQSDDSHLTRVSVTRESQNDELSSSTHDKIDVSTLPLPALPPKKRRSRLRGSPSKYHSRSRHESNEAAAAATTATPIGEELNVLAAATTAPALTTNVKDEALPSHLSNFQQRRRESLETSTRSFHEKLEARRMHYRMGGGGGATGAGGGGNSGSTAGSASGMHMPTYLFGEQYYGMPSGGARKTTVAPATKEEIFLNKSGWVQVTSKRGSVGPGNDENRGYRRAASYGHQNGGSDMRNTIRVIQIDNTRRSDLARQALLQHQHSVADPSGFALAAAGSKFTCSKVEELIQRNEARLHSGITASHIVAASAASRDPALRPGYRIVDPQLASILNERPGFLPVKNLNDADSPPPITPILSPPPAFQDNSSSSKSKHFDRRKPISSRQLLLQQQQQLLQRPIPTTILHASSNGGGGAPSNSNPKGMVFSRSFEYDARRPAPTDTYVETFSRSFDGNLTEQRPQPLQRERSPNFSTLTGNSPNYLSKKDSGGGSSGSLRSRDSSPKYQPQPQTTAYLNNSIKEAPPAYSVAAATAASSSNTSNKYSPRARHERSFERSKSHNVLGRSRKSQFSRVGSSGPLGGGGGSQVPLAVGMSRFRSFDTTISQRLNSCDSGARSDLSNDELDNDDDEGGSTEFLTTNYHHNTSPFKTQRQRSLTPDRNESHSSSSSLRKQRSLTPESRSLTPEDRRKKGSQASLMGSRQNSSSRSNTLERKQRHDEKTSNISRSSSSSSYSGRESHEMHGHAMPMGSGSGVNSGSHHRRSLGRNAKQTEEHRIRRSRSLQLSERSPNRSQHKMIVCVGQPHPTSNQSPIYQQSNIRTTSINNGAHSNFPPTIRTTGKSQPILLNSGNNGGSNSGGRLRNSDIDKSRSFDFDYCNYNSAAAGTPPNIGITNSSGGNSNINQNVAMRLDFDKSRSFDDDYRESLNSNNNLGAVSSMRYLQANEGSSGSGSGAGRLRRSSPAGSGSGGGSASADRSTRSPQSSGSSCNNLNVPRQQSTSPQSYGTRLCDHELTYDMIRKSLDRSPIMDFRRGESGDYELSQSVISSRNRETINAGGNSELNFMNNDARIYEHPTTTTTSSLKQQRSLGHTQSPSESQYSLERLHNSRDSITPEALSDYRADYIYRHGQQSSHGSSNREARSNNRASSKNTTAITTTTPPSTKSTATKREATKTKTSDADACSFWPHCGACQTLGRTVSPAAAAKTKTTTKSSFASVKRQNSLHNPKIQHSKCQYLALHSANSAASLPLRRNHSLKAENAEHNGYANVSTVSVNVNVIKLDSDVPIASPSAPATTTRNRTQWTLLCSGASPATASQTASATQTATISNSARNVCSTAAVKQPLERVLPLAATSLVFLGDCEMPITRERAYDDDDGKHFERLATSKYKVQGNGRIRRREAQEMVYQVGEWNRRNSLQQTTTAAKYCDDEEDDGDTNNNNNMKNNATATTTTTTHHKQQQAMAANYLSEDERSISLPNIAQASTLKGFPRTTTTNDGISIIGIRNGFSANLSHQIRAVSSPSLTDNMHMPVESSIRIVASTSANAAQLAAAASVENAPQATSSSTLAGGGNNSSNSIRTTSLPTSQSVGVLQKFKRTLTNFNKNQQQPTSGSSTSAPVASTSGNSLLAPSANSSALIPATEVTTTNSSAASDVTAAAADATSAKYRFGPLIWRSSKERRKTKYNRRDKCNSGDSGIQIELENDEQFARALGAGGANAAAARNADEEDTPKSRAIRRTNSAKATSISDQSTTAAMSAKKKILKRMEIYNEREAPESLPTRSLSQPNGLETFGISRADLDDSDSDSIASHDEGPNYYPIYAEVLYSFTAAGPQELGLERGALIEILRKEVGPWWFGRIKKEDASLVEEIYDPELGWFPKEFVRVIQSPETDVFFLAHLSQLSQMQQQQPAIAAPVTIMLAKPPPPPATQPLLPNAAPTAAVVQAPSPATAGVDRDNVTTIVIESPSYHAAAVAACAASTSNSSVSTSTTSAALVPSRSLNLIMDNADILRRSAVKELLDTEVNYVNLLASICEGYLPAMSKRIDIFSPNSIRLIFSNITAIYKFQRKFLEALRKGIEQNQIAKVFLKMHKGFLCYSNYCNAYPRALIELESYDRVKDAKTILDNCRESENLAELPLSAHLLAPVQRICRYPLHLGEILKTALKATETAAVAYDMQQLEQIETSQLDIADTRETIDMALEAMKSITEAVNEGKRHSETIARHQSSFQNFKGPPLHLHSTRFFLQIDATRQKQNLWNSSCTLFLFDNQLIYCKRDIIKRSQFIYKGRIFLDRCRVVNVRDGKMFGHTIKNSLRIYCEARDKWYDFSFRSANRKHRFLNTLALERQFGGKALYVSEMTGFEYAFEERDYSDQSDYELPESESGGGGLSTMRMREYVYDVSGVGAGNGTSATSGESSVPDSPAKSYSTLPKKSSTQTRGESSGGGGGGSTNIETHTGSLGRRRLGNWFRKPKSSNCTPNHSPTHKPAPHTYAGELQLPVEASYDHNLTLTAESVRDVSSSSSS